MTFAEIRVYPDPVLARKAAAITDIDAQVRQLAEKMAATMYAAPGVGLAAPQVGVSRRLIVADVGEERGRGLITLINPVIIAGEGEDGIEEGCLSVPGFTAPVKRQAEIVVRGYTPEEKEVEITAQGLLAIVLQHEIDHLNGILFIDRIGPVKKDLFRRKFKKGKLQPEK